MKFDTEGTYTLQYTATDYCGNETVEERELIVANPRTVLYTDGTFIINESPKDRAKNEALHGTATNEYPWLEHPNSYSFRIATDRPWHEQKNNIKSVSFGSPIQPSIMSQWFISCQSLVSVDFMNLDTTNVASISSAFAYCKALEEIDLSSLDTSSMSDASSLLYNCTKLKRANLANWHISQDASNLFSQCIALEEVDFTNVKIVGNAASLLDGCKVIKTLDLSSFDTSGITNMNLMFSDCQKLSTIYASSLFTTSQVTKSTGMFQQTYALKGGAGTAWSSSNPKDKTYAHIDGGTADPGYFTAKAA